MFGMVVGAFGTAPDTNTLQLTQQTVIEQLAAPQTALLPVEANPIPFVREERILRGDTVAALLGRVGADDSAALNFLLTHDTARSIARQMSPGKTITAQISDKGELLSLVFPLNGGKDQALFVERQADSSFQASERSLPLETIVQIKSSPKFATPCSVPLMQPVSQTASPLSSPTSSAGISISIATCARVIVSASCTKH